MDLFNLANGLVLVGAALWYWPHCAVPALRAFRAPRWMFLLGLGTTAFLVVASAGFTVATQLGHTGGWMFALLVAGPLWVLLLATLMWPSLSILYRLSQRQTR